MPTWKRVSTFVVMASFLCSLIIPDPGSRSRVPAAHRPLQHLLVEALQGPHDHLLLRRQTLLVSAAENKREQTRTTRNTREHLFLFFSLFDLGFPRSTLSQFQSFQIHRSTFLSIIYRSSSYEKTLLLWKGLSGIKIPRGVLNFDSSWWNGCLGRSKETAIARADSWQCL